MQGEQKSIIERRLVLLKKAEAWLRAESPNGHDDLRNYTYLETVAAMSRFADAELSSLRAENARLREALETLSAQLRMLPRLPAHGFDTLQLQFLSDIAGEMERALTPPEAR